MADSRVTALYRYPVKGLSPEELSKVSLKAGGTMPWDRAFAIENGTTDFDPNDPQYFPKTKFLMLAKNERLATLETRFDDETGTLTVLRRDMGGKAKQVAKGDITSRIGRQLIEHFLTSYMEDDLRGPPRIVTVPDAAGAGFSFSDVPMKVLSLINMASVRDLERVTGEPVDPLRFRGNVYVDELPAWSELEWENKTFCIGSLKVKGILRTQRCAATNVNPTTAKRDMNVPQTLRIGYGHMDMGLYCEVLEDGDLATGDVLTPPA
jgi:uncharacterized protein YcbX